LHKLLTKICTKSANKMEQAVKILLLASTQLFTISSASSNPPAAFCPVAGAEYYDKENDETIQEYFECPGPDDPPNFTRCCDEKCCTLRHIDSVMGLDLPIAIALSVSVIIICIVLGITIIVCCFWSPCPMYDTCGGGYKRREGAVPFGMDYADTDPLTGNGATTATKYYTAQDVDIKNGKPDHV